MNTPALARSTDPQSSHDAARSVDTSTLEALVLDVLAAYPAGLTSKELARITGEDRVTLSPRLRPLVRKGLARETNTRRGRSIVWAVAR